MADDYEVGYGKTPQAARFKKGQSGNPKGRPKGSLNDRTRFDAAKNKKYPATGAGKKTTVCALDMIFQQMIVNAAKGDAAARRDFLQYYKFFHELDGATLDLVESAAQRKKVYDSLMKRMNRMGEDRGIEGYAKDQWDDADDREVSNVIP